MKSEFYNFSTNENALSFEFQSVSERKIVNKIVVYSPFPDNPQLFNLALGDILENGEVSDLTVSNNADMEKVIATIVQTMFCFFEKYPECFVYFKGSTPERTRLYRIIISRELEEANRTFQIYGIIDSEITVFERNCSYDSFVLALKNQNYL
ncbi:MAG: hypothetical protein U5M51_01380 [Emticicia sp.]|nr:hypothetical protein [Emticicia sp.]